MNHTVQPDAVRSLQTFLDSDDAWDVKKQATTARVYQCIFFHGQFLEQTENPPNSSAFIDAA